MVHAQCTMAHHALKQNELDKLNNFLAMCSRAFVCDCLTLTLGDQSVAFVLFIKNKGAMLRSFYSLKTRVRSVRYLVVQPEPKMAARWSSSHSTLAPWPTYKWLQ